MRDTQIATICLALMIVIALISWEPARFQPITGLDRALAAIGDQTTLMQLLHQAERASRGE